jgi:protein Mpv17
VVLSSPWETSSLRQVFYVFKSVVDGKKKIDWKRNLNLFLVGNFYVAPCLHAWYCKILPVVMGRIFGETAPKAARVFSSMAADQLLFAPIFLCGFFIVDGVFKQPNAEGLQKGIQNYKDKIWETLKINWMIWPIAMTINFWFMPLQYQVLFANCVGLFWNVILSYIAYDEKTPVQKAVDVVA